MKRTYTHSNNALDHLPRRPLVRYSRGHLIYSDGSDSLYAIASGRVNVSTTGAGHKGVIIRIVPPQGLFGESCMIGGNPGEQATALDDVELMSWSRRDLEQFIEKEPMLGVALMEELLVTSLEIQDRIQLAASYKTYERLMFTLVDLAQSLGEEMQDGAHRMPSLSHRLIAQHVGTSREIVTSQMGRLRDLGMVKYTRKTMEVYCGAVTELLSSKGIKLQHRGPAAAAVKG